MSSSRVLAVRKFTMECSHHLPNHGGHCRRPHGHSYKLFVAFSKPFEDMKDGMVEDFSILKDVVQRHILDKLDHTDLNQTFDVPTAEVLAKEIHSTLNRVICDSSLKVEWVRLYETENCYVEYPW